MLPIPTIDARGYEDLLAEATARIRVHNPEWLNFNDSDPGMTLLQLWAFMAENLLFQAGLIPERNRIKFLELLGIEPAPARAAEGVIAVENLKGRLELVTVEADLELLAGRIPFRTRNGLTIAPVEVRPYVKQTADIAADVRAEVEDQYALLYPSYATPGTTFDYYEVRPVQWSATGTAPLDLAETVDGALWLAVLARTSAELERTRQLLGGQVLTLGVVPGVTTDFKVLPVGGAETPSDTPSLEFHLPNTDEPLPAARTDRKPKYRPVQTRTEHDVLLEPGVVQLQLPAPEQLRVWSDLDPVEDGVGAFPPAVEGDDAERLITWIRMRPVGGLEQAGRRTATLSWVGANAALVRQRARVVREVFGTGTGLADQTFQLANTPVLTDTLVVTVAGTRWQLSNDLMTAGPEVVGAGGPNVAAPDRPSPFVYRVDRGTGTVTFGDGIHGARPPAGAQLVATYDYGGGRAGLVGIGAITKAAFLPDGAKVSNPLPTWGADEPQSITDAERTIAGYVRHRDRMVASDDFAAVARATPGVDLGRIEVLPLHHPDLPGVSSPGVVTLLLIPLYDSSHPDTPSPDQHFLRAVCEHVDERRLITTEVHLRGPIYEAVWLSVGIDVMAGRDIGPVREAVKLELRTFLSPLHGGHAAAGWPLATPVNRLEALAVAARVDGVAKVFDVLLTDTDGAPLDQVPMVTSLHLPRLVGIEVRQGDPLPLTDLQGVVAVSDPTRLPIPIVPEEC